MKHACEVECIPAWTQLCLRADDAADPSVAEDLESVQKVIGLRHYLLCTSISKDFLFAKAASEIFPSRIEAAHYAAFSRSLEFISALRRDMYSLRELGDPAELVELSDPDPLAVSRYSRSSAATFSVELRDGGGVHEFSLSKGVVSIAKLKILVNGRVDAAVFNEPAYASALLFSPAYNVIRARYRRWMEWCLQTLKRSISDGTDFGAKYSSLHKPIGKQRHVSDSGVQFTDLQWLMGEILHTPIEAPLLEHLLGYLVSRLTKELSHVKLVHVTQRRVKVGPSPLTLFLDLTPHLNLPSSNPAIRTTGIPFSHTIVECVSYASHHSRMHLTIVYVAKTYPLISHIYRLLQSTPLAINAIHYEPGNRLLVNRAVFKPILGRAPLTPCVQFLYFASRINRDLYNLLSTLPKLSVEHLKDKLDKLVHLKDKLVHLKDKLVHRKDKLVYRKDKLVHCKDKLVNLKDILSVILKQNKPSVSIKARESNGTYHEVIISRRAAGSAQNYSGSPPRSVPLIGTTANSS
ncbi:uncharacterized protein BDR25DRAFT_356824 [Lindgomyces ingoldianus]|uniref:Uncharacterized protein n=1 Tax=Lindgomyces ingoldianus TaxID=673940 RepID=A0ACB6QQ03_9PLEO|nr:uncharacterized protein BDR25DRAFT_356824 [Lindgomyces ingoldianus]KAF2469059.1 hypothetical protein BDR25DRAFT_356824 [Lindgomyces ingoldianus]